MDRKTSDEFIRELRKEERKQALKKACNELKEGVDSALERIRFNRAMRDERKAIIWMLDAGYSSEQIKVFLDNANRR